MYSENVYRFSCRCQTSWPCGKEAEAGGLRASPRGDHPAVGAAAEPAQPLPGGRGEQEDTHSHKNNNLKEKNKTEQLTVSNEGDISDQPCHIFELLFVLFFFLPS